MGYFSNHTEWEIWAKDNCYKCGNWNDIDPESPDWRQGKNCPIEYLHLIHNYEECNKPDSFLHDLIPLSEDGLSNKQCTFFWPKAETVDNEWLEPFIRKVETSQGTTPKTKESGSNAI